MNIVLIGYRGTGKSVVGAHLAKHLQMPYMGMDELIVEKAGMSIPEIVENKGWPVFRDLETDMAWDLSTRDHIIIDTGGGVIERPENIEILRNNARIFWLKASVDTIVSRIQEDTARPALTEGKTFTEEVADVLTQRHPKYKHAADYEIDTDQLTPEQVVERIIEIWEKS